MVKNGTDPLVVPRSCVKPLHAHALKNACHEDVDSVVVDKIEAIDACFIRISEMLTGLWLNSTQKA